MRNRLMLIVALLLLATPTWAQSIGPAQRNVLRLLEGKYGSLNMGTDDDRRQFALIVAEQFAFSFPGEGYGSKRADPGRPQTKDVVARQKNGVFEGWDLVNGVTRKVTCDGSRYDLTGQTFIAVTPKDHLGTSTPPPSNPPPSNPPPTTDVQQQILAELKKTNDLLAQILAAQQSQSLAITAAVSQLQQEVAKGIKIRFN